MEGTSHSDDSDSMAQVMFTHLLLLGLDVEDMECVYKISFHRDMFKGYNKAGANAVLHFLFYNLNPTVCDEQFRDCWPIIDKKSEAQFRKACFTWLVGIKKSEPDVQWPVLNASSLQFPGGSKFIHILFRLSTYVLKQSISANQDQQFVLINQVLPNTTPNMDAVKLASIQDNADLELQRFMNQMYMTNSSHQMWNKYASELVHGIREMSKAQRENEQEKRTIVTGLAENAIKQGCNLPVKRTLNMFDGEKDDSNIKRQQRLQRVKSSWDKVNTFYNGLENDRKVVKAILEHSTSSDRLDANDIGIRIPGLLLKQCEREIRQRQIDNVYIGGRLNLLSVLQLWNLCLRLYLEQLEEADLPDVTKEVSGLTMQAHKFHSFLREIQALREEISAIFIPDLEQSIQNLRKETRVETEDTGPLSQNSLQLTTPTFPSSSENRSPSNPATPAGLFTPKAPKKKDTPTVLSEMMASITNVTQKTPIAQPSRLAFDKLKTSQRSSPAASFASKNLKQTRVGKIQRDVVSASSKQKPVKVNHKKDNLPKSKSSNKSLIEREEAIDSYQSILDQMALSVADSVIDRDDTGNSRDMSYQLSSGTSLDVDLNNVSAFSQALMLELEQESGCEVNATLEDSFAPLKYGILLDKSPMKLGRKSTSKSSTVSLDSSFDMNRVPELKSSLSTTKSPSVSFDSPFNMNQVPPLKSPISMSKSSVTSEESIYERNPVSLKSSISLTKSSIPSLDSASSINLVATSISSTSIEKSTSPSLDSSFNINPMFTPKSPNFSTKSSTGSVDSSPDLDLLTTVKSPIVMSPIESFKLHHRIELKPNLPPPPPSSAWDIQRQMDDLFSQGCKIFEDIDDD